MNQQNFKTTVSSSATWKMLPDGTVRVEQLDTWVGSSLSVDLFFGEPVTVSKITWRGNMPPLNLSPLFTTLNPSEQFVSQALNITNTNSLRISCSPRNRSIGTHDRWLEFKLEYR